MAKEFNGVYKVTEVITTLSDGTRIELGHYADGDKEYKDKPYVVTKFKTRKGEEKESTKALGLTLAQIKELQTVDLSKYDTETNVEEIFD